MTNKYLFEVWTTKEYKSLPEGAHIHVTNNKGENYVGLASIGPTTFEIEVPKEICTTENQLEKLLDKAKLNIKPKYHGN